ncbi:APC membrane recruitment protein 2 [Erpetoichthys calabaricus]|uniref:APC membrane recruitment protein 2 n=1 Tax=Erpetoichthys calabaricus TaxID=27687 RepID=UPI0022348FCA|nr:APC membrane recruitment protein 2 [Erpetoichthys calabaricus]
METSRRSSEAASEKASIRLLRGSAEEKQAGAATAADMDLHCECSEPPLTEPPPSGKINKAAFKLFRKRKAGSSVPSIFGMKSKGETKSSGNTGLVRSKTHDGLAEAVLEGSRKEESSSNDHLNITLCAKAVSGPVEAAGGPVSKSLSFFSILKKNGKAESSRGENAEPKASSKQKKGLKGLLNNMRWHKKEKNSKEERGEASDPPLDAPCPVSLTSSLEFIKEEVQQVPESEPELNTNEDVEDAVLIVPGEEPQATSTGDATEKTSDSEGILPDLYKDADEQEGGDVAESEEESQGQVEASKVVGLEVEDLPEVITSQLSEVSLMPNPQCSGSSSPEIVPCSPLPTTTITPPEPSGIDPPAEQCIDRICSMFTDVTSLKSFDSLTGCGDIIADHEEEAGSGNGISNSGASLEKALHLKSKVKFPPKKTQSSGVVTYQGGGEEMATPDEVDEADLQGFWDILPQSKERVNEMKKEGTPEVQRKIRDKEKSEKSVEGAANSSVMKSLGLSKIPISGNSRFSKTHKDGERNKERDMQESVPNSDEGYWDSTTPGPEDESGSSRFVPKDSLPRDSYSGDALFDLYGDPDESLPGVVSDEDVTSTSMSGPKLTPSSESTFRSLKGSTSLPRDSKIPVSVKQIPSHSASQGALAPNVTSTGHHQAAKSDQPRTKIPVARVLVKRTSNKPSASLIAKHAAYHDHFKK